MLKRDVAVIEAAETLVQKWREFDNNGQAEDPEDYAEALIRAVSARKADLKPTTAADHPTPSITVGTQVRLTGVVRAEKAEGVGRIMVDIGYHASIPMHVGGTCICVPAEALEVIRQPFKRGEVVYAKGQATRPDNEWVIVADEQSGTALAVVAEFGWKVVELPALDYERRPSRPKEER